MGDIARITVEKEQHLLRSMMGDVPAMQTHTVPGIQKHILIRQSPLRRCLGKRWVGEKDHGGLLQIHTTIQQGQPKQQEQDVFYHSLFHVLMLRNLWLLFQRFRPWLYHHSKLTRLGHEIFHRKGARRRDGKAGGVQCTGGPDIASVE